jgi:hypothetical protein
MAGDLICAAIECGSTGVLKGRRAKCQRAKMFGAKNKIKIPALRGGGDFILDCSVYKGKGYKFGRNILCNNQTWPINIRTITEIARVYKSSV